MKILLTDDLGNYHASLIGMFEGKFLILDEDEKFIGITPIKEFTLKEIPDNVLYTNGTLENSIKTVFKNKYLPSVNQDMKDNLIFDQLNLLTGIVSLTMSKDTPELKLSSATKEDLIKLADKLRPIFASVDKYREAKERFGRERG